MTSYTFETTTPAHIKHIGLNMRVWDMKECAAFGMDPYEALISGYNRSSRCQTIMFGGVPAGIIGISPCPSPSEMTDVGLFPMPIIWMLGTDDLTRHPIKFMRETHAWKDQVLGVPMQNFVHEGNIKARMFLEHLGAYFDYENLVFFGGEPFMHFMIGGKYVS